MRILCNSCRAMIEFSPQQLHSARPSRSTTRLNKMALGSETLRHRDKDRINNKKEIVKGQLQEEERKDGNFGALID
ncbi:hypothetical protein TNCV_2850971 [Trichonephila clavipes]|nr:hypothetical protein TNCV_2850971 [Trichonephila clavipes]